MSYTGRLQAIVDRVERESLLATKRAIQALRQLSEKNAAKIGRVRWWYPTSTVGDEKKWWKAREIDPIGHAEQLWQISRGETCSENA